MWLKKAKMSQLPLSLPPSLFLLLYPSVFFYYLGKASKLTIPLENQSSFNFILNLISTYFFEKLRVKLCQANNVK